jgi:hypothetical protein
MTEDVSAACFVRSRVVAGGADGRILFVRVGWLTPDLAAAIADDVRDAPTGTWLQVRVPDDLTDAAVAALLRWMRRAISVQVRVDVFRTGEAPPLGPSVTSACDPLSQADPERAGESAESARHGAGTDLADPPEQQDHKRRSEQ